VTPWEVPALPGQIRVVGVHGVGNYRPGETPIEARTNLTAAWQVALGGGPGLSSGRSRPGEPAGAGLDLAVAYYAHHLRRPGSQGSSPSLERLSPSAKTMATEWIMQVLPQAGVAQGPATYPLRQLVAWLAQQRGLPARAVEWFVATFFTEVADYLDNTDPDARDHVRHDVAELIRARRAQVVIAHSLGSVVAYETLWSRRDLHIDVLITLGSPLALPHAVFPRLQPAPADRGARPPGVKRWINLADPGDLVAIPVKGVSRFFAGVDIDEHTTIGCFDFHLAANYLASPRLADLIRAHATGDQ
jgi:hypothetical protein